MEVPPVVEYAAFIQLPREEQVSLMTLWRVQMKNKEIIERMGIYPVRYYALLGKLGLKDRVKDLEAAMSGVGEVAVADESVVQNVTRSDPPRNRRRQQGNEMRVQQFHAAFTGRFTGADIAARLKLIAAALEGIDEEFVTDVRITL